MENTMWQPDFSPEALEASGDYYYTVADSSKIKPGLELETIEEAYTLTYKGYIVHLNWDRMLELGVLYI